MSEIEVPPHFLCPISLQMMRDPVTVSTGITYDRDSIEKWLSSSSCTKRRPIVAISCPVTKQPLSNSEDLTPNHVLRRLIQGWCSLNAGHGVERIPTPKAQVDRAHVVKLLREAMKNPSGRLQCLRRLNSLVRQSEKNRTYLKDAESLEFLAFMLNNNNDEAIIEEAIQILSNINSFSDTLLRQLLSQNTDIIDCLISIVSKKAGSIPSRSSAISFLNSLYAAADQAHKTFAKDDLFKELTRAITDRIATKPALQVLLHLAPWGRNRIKSVQNGAVFSTIEVLLNSNVGRECELAIVVLDRLCECAEGRAELLRHGGGVAVLARKILRVSHLANDKAVRILYSVWKNRYGNCGVLEEMVEVGVVGKMCLLLQVNGGSLKTKERVKEILLHLQPFVSKVSKCVLPLEYDRMIGFS